MIDAFNEIITAVVTFLHDSSFMNDWDSFFRSTPTLKNSRLIMNPYILNVAPNQQEYGEKLFSSLSSVKKSRVSQLLQNYP